MHAYVDGCMCLYAHVGVCGRISAHAVCVSKSKCVDTGKQEASSVLSKVFPKNPKNMSVKIYQKCSLTHPLRSGEWSAPRLSHGEKCDFVGLRHQAQVARTSAAQDWKVIVHPCCHGPFKK